MLRYIVVVVFFLVAQGRHIPPKESQECILVDGPVDKILNFSNDEFRTNRMVEYTQGVNQYINLWDGSQWAPFKIFLSTTPRGEMSSLDSLSRSGNATKCSDGDRITLDATLQFDVLGLHYNNAQTEYLHIKTKGKLTFQVKPTVNVFIIKTRDECRLDSYSLATTDGISYRFQPDSGLIGFMTGEFEAAMLQFALRRADTSPMLFFVKNASQHFVESYFTKAWCESLKR